MSGNGLELDDNQYCLGYDDLTFQDNAGSNALQQEALGRFLAKVEKRAFRMAQIATQDSEEALDIVQDAMFKLAEKYGNRGEEEWGALFHRILQSRIYDWYRRRSVRSRVLAWWRPGMAGGEEDTVPEYPDDRMPSPEQELYTGRGMQDLEQALRELPLRQQQVFLLRAWEGLDVKQTAAAMQCAEGSVKTHYSRAIHRLRERLQDHEQE